MCDCVCVCGVVLYVCGVFCERESDVLWVCGVPCVSVECVCFSSLSLSHRLSVTHPNSHTLLEIIFNDKQ